MTLQAISDTLSRLGRSRNRPPRESAAARPVWEAWRGGDTTLARSLALQLAATGESVDEARHALVLVAVVTGANVEAIATHRLINPRYQRIAELDEPVIWAHLRRGDVAGALAFAERRISRGRGVITRRLKLALEHPLEVATAGVADLSFTDDALSPLMPGIAAEMNGRPTVARLDTGGSYVHLSAEAAAAHSVTTVASEREFAALGWHTVHHGIADLRLGSVHMRNVPVAVHDGALPTGPIADAFGVKLGPIIGTNVLELFLATIDGPGRRLLLSDRRDAAARAAHLERIGPARHETPFIVWSDHLMLARGRLPGLDAANLFIDSGLVVANEDQGQAAVLISRSGLATLGLPLPAEGRFAELPGTVSIGTAARDGLAAYPIPDSTWRDFGDWGGIRVDALVSWGFLGGFTWTIDFARRRFLFGEPPAPG